MFRLTSAAAYPAAAVVTACDGPNGLAAIRSLGRLGIDVFALDSDPGAVGLRSRYARAAVAASPSDDEQAFVSFLAGLGDHLETPAVFLPTSDAVLNAVARNRGALGDRFLCPFPEWNVLEHIQDKWFQVREAEATGIPVPRTAPAPTAELGFPVLVKPADPVPFQARFGGRHAFVCSSLEETETAFERSIDYRPLVQEFIPGGDEALYTFGAYISADGEALGVFSGRKLRQTPPAVGTCRVGEALWVDEVVEQGLAFVQALRFHGICQVEFKLDDRDGRYKLMEINPRLWQWHGLAAACGVDVVRLAYGDLTGMRRGAPARMGRERHRWAITLMGRSRPAPQRPPYVDALFAKDDLRPAFADVRRQASSAARRLAKALR